MAYDEAFLQYVIRQLEPFASIRFRKMFGGVGIYGDELFFAIIADDQLYFKADESNQGDFIEAGMNKFMDMNYYQVPNEVLDDLGELQLWVEKAIAVAAQAKKSK